MKNKLFIGLALVVGCHANLESTNRPQPALAAMSPAVFQPMARDDSARYFDAVKNYFETSLVKGNFNGAVLVAKGGSIIYENYRGFENLRTRDQVVDANSPLHIASVSKNFAAAAVLKLAEQGRLNINDTITKFFPAFPYQNITVHMLMSHRSGLPEYMHFMDKMWDKRIPASNQDVLNVLYNKRPNIEFKAGTRFNYSNTNFLLLALIVEKISALPYPVFMKQTFFDPLQMQDTYIYTPSDSAYAIPTFQATGSPWKLDFLENTYGDKNIYTTPRDLLKWVTAYSKGQVVNPFMMEAAFTPYSHERPGTHNYGLGWRLLMLKNGKKVIYHNGRWHGTNAALSYLPDEDVSIIIIGNRYNSNIYKAARNSYDIFGEYLKDAGSDDDENTVRVVHKSSKKRSIAKKSTQRKSSYTTTKRSTAKTARK